MIIKKYLIALTVIVITLYFGNILLTNNNSYENNNSELWYSDSLIKLDKFIDLSYLNHKPAGKYGFVKAKENGLVYGNGKPARFFGVNIEAHSLFIYDKKKILSHAKKLARLGVNLVRLHHHDSFWVTPSLISGNNNSQKLNHQSLDSYHWWIKCLRDQGIYVWLDLHVQRPWREGDRIPGWHSDLLKKSIKGDNQAKGFVYFNDRMQQLTKKFNRKLLTAINPYTNLTLKDDSAIMAVLITNENDITHHYGNIFINKNDHPYHNAIFQELAQQFSKKHKLPLREITKTWDAGLSKYYLNDIEARFNTEMIDDLQNIGIRVPIVTTNLWGNSALYSIPALTQGDIIDVHSYMGSANKNPLTRNPAYNPNFLHWIGYGQVYGMPLTVSEFNAIPETDEVNSFIPIVSVSYMGAFQGWDAIMLYGYSHDGFAENTASPWSSYRHAGILGVLPSMALLYRQGHVSPANNSVVFNLSNEMLFEKNISPDTSRAIRTAMEKHQISISIPDKNYLEWQKPTRVNNNELLVIDLNKNFINNKSKVISDTGEITRYWNKGILKINTDKSQLAMGKLLDSEITLKSTKIISRTQDSAIIFTSLDNNSIQFSKRILLTAVARVKKINAGKSSHYVSQPVAAKLTLKSIMNSINIIPLNGKTQDVDRLSYVKNTEGEFVFHISEHDDTHWYLISEK